MHRARNLYAKLPERERERVKHAYWQALDDAINERDAKQRLQALVDELDKGGYTAAAKCLADDLDALVVHLRFCEVAICEAGRVRSAGRIKTSPEVLELFAAKPRARGSGGVGGDRRGVGDRQDPRAARAPGGRRESGRHGDPSGAREDRPARRAHAGQVVVGGRFGRGVDARRGAAG